MIFVIREQDIKVNLFDQVENNEQRIFYWFYNKNAARPSSTYKLKATLG